MVLSVQNLSLSFGENSLFSDINFDVNDKDKVGLVGVNGAGKTSIFKIITGEYEPTSGIAVIAKDTKIGYMEQHTCSVSNRTLYDELASVFQDLSELETEIINVNYNLENNIGDLNENIKLQERLNDKFVSDGGLTYKSITRSTLLGLGFTEDEFSITTDKLSGGQRSKVTLAKMLLSKADFLLLDEPTNHLDIKSVEWLESFIINYNAAILVISHDRYFLDKVTDKTVELEHGKVRSYKGNYSEFLVKKDSEQHAVEEKYKNDIKEVERLEGVVAQQRQWNREKNIKTAESKLKQIEKIKEQLVIPDAEVEKIKFDFTPKAVSGNDVLILDDVSKSFGKKKIFSNISMHIKKGERVFLIGDNGCGKTTLLKIIMGEYSSDSGRVVYGENLYKGYFDQVQAKLNLNKTAINEVWDSYPAMTQTSLRSALAAFLFKGDDVFKELSLCSGGERARIALLKLMLGGYNFLLLDEPTNHLDAFSREELEKTLKDYEGTMLIVSHDRYFINKIATRILEMNGDSCNEYIGNYDYYSEKKQRELEKAAPELKPEVQKPIKQNSYKLRKENLANFRKAKTQLKSTEENIENIESEIERINKELESTEISADYEKLMDDTSRLHELEELRNKAYEQWEETQETFEKLEQICENNN